jgi:hypothetical protein
LPLATWKMRANLSSLPVAMLFPSGAKHTENTLHPSSNSWILASVHSSGPSLKLDVSDLPKCAAVETFRCRRDGEESSAPAKEALSSSPEALESSSIGVLGSETSETADINADGEEAVGKRLVGCRKTCDSLVDFK